MSETPAILPRSLPPADEFAPWLKQTSAEHLQRVRAIVEYLKARRKNREHATTTREDAVDVLELFNDLDAALGDAGAAANLMAEVHPDPAVRSVADEVEQQVSKLDTEISLDVDLFAVVARLEPLAENDQLDAGEQRFLERVLRGFRRSGVDTDAETRTRITQVSEELVKVGQEFGRNIREDVRSIEISPERLAGMPPDWVADHTPGENGLVTVTTDYPDAIPFRTFCTDAPARAELTVVSLNVGWPENDAVLQRLFELRAELSGLLSFTDWADYDARVKMIGTGEAIPAFIDKITAAAAASGAADKAVLVAQRDNDAPELAGEEFTAADLMFYAEQVRRTRFDVDAQLVRTYFDESAVRQGLLDITSELFGVRYEAIEANVWDESVSAYDVYLEPTESEPQSKNQGEPGLLGRIYLDLFPRGGKFKHAAQFTLVTGLEDRQLPEGVLVCNFPTGLMEHDQVVTLFHEFGHLLHHVLAGRHRWYRFSGVATEWDFVEAPSQLLEEWAWDTDVLARFATNADGEPIPADVVAKMKAGEEFGKGYLARTQMFYAAMSYYFHVERPADITAKTAELQSRYSLFPYIDGTHMPCSFGHLHGYATGYYTYMWSLVIAKDLLSAFDPKDLMDLETAARYRDLILVPGGTADAADLVENFLGRPYSFASFERWLNERPDPEGA